GSYVWSVCRCHFPAKLLELRSSCSFHYQKEIDSQQKERLISQQKRSPSNDLVYWKAKEYKEQVYVEEIAIILSKHFTSFYLQVSLNVIT
ncbi:hypothetical protein M8C21_033822, partial [Ambrosia artemisiifolia]